MTDELSKGEQIIIAMTWNWQVRHNQYDAGSSMAVDFGMKTLNRTEAMLHKLITDPDARTLMIHDFEGYDKLFSKEEQERLANRIERK